MFVTNWISTTKIQKISEITNFFRHYFLSRTEVNNNLKRNLLAVFPAISQFYNWTIKNLILYKEKTTFLFT